MFPQVNFATERTFAAFSSSRDFGDGPAQPSATNEASVPSPRSFRSSVSWIDGPDFGGKVY